MGFMEITDLICAIQDILLEYENNKEESDSEKEISMWRKRFMVASLANHKKFTEICECFEETNSSAFIYSSPENVLLEIVKSIVKDD
jgi:hypothetical protein